MNEAEDLMLQVQLTYICHYYLSFWLIRLEMHNFVFIIFIHVLIAWTYFEDEIWDNLI